MRGGFVACLSAPDTARLESAAERLKWYSGEPVFHRHGRLQIACLVDRLHGPMVEIRDGRLLLGHGAAPEPLDALERRDRFAGLDSDGVSLRAIRDRLGEVPLFYRRVGDAFWLATEIHPLVSVAPAEPDLEWLAAFSAMVEYPDTTGWAGIKRVLPGAVLHVDPELRVTSRRYFRPSVRIRGRRPASRVAALQLRDLFFTAVAKRTSDDCGVLLSGGLDSSAVAVVAAKTTHPRLLTVSHPTLPQVDETRYARAISDVTSLPLTTVELEPEPWDPADDIEMFGAPPIGVPTNLYARGFEALATAGCDVVLDGHDGDGTLGNMYAWSANTLLDARPDRLARAAHDYGPQFVLRKLAKDFVSPSVGNRLRRRSMSADVRTSFVPYFRGETATRLVREGRWRAPRSGWEDAQRRALLPPATQSYEQIEVVGARFGIDVQHPFADRELIDYLMTLPHAVKASTARLKPVLRDALADLLPELVAERDDKTYFTTVIDARVDFDACYRWIRDSGVRLPDVDYGRLFRDAAKPVNDRMLWTRLASAHVFLAGCRA